MGSPDGWVQPRASVRTLADVQPERVTWLWPGRLPAGKLVILDGDPSTGKSALTLDLAARVSAGKPWPDGATCPAGDVLLMSAEDGLADTIAPRLLAAGADVAHVHALQAVTVYDDHEDPQQVLPSLPRDMGRIEEVVTAYGVRLAVVDVLMAYLHGGVDSHRDQDVRGVLHHLGALADRTGCTVVLIRHMNKTGGTSPLYRGGGSIGIIGAARAAFLVARDPEDEARRVLAVTKSNLAAEPPALAYRLTEDPQHGCVRLEWEAAPTDHKAADLLRPPEYGDERTERDDAASFIRAYLTDVGGSAPSRDVLKAGRAAGFNDNVLTKARPRAKVRTGRQGFGPGASWVWSIDGPIDGIEASTKEPGSMPPMSINERRTGRRSKVW